MEIKFSGNEIVFDKKLSDLDNFVIDFVNLLNASKIRYVIVSGYVSILFGRPRVTEDIDFLIENIDFNKFTVFISNLEKDDFSVMNSDDKKKLYSDFLVKNTALRIYRGNIFPNAEVKFVKNKLDKEALNNPLKVILNDKELLISPLEQQIAYKLYLGSRKDIQDARFIFDIFKDKLDIKEILNVCRILKVEDKFKKYIAKGVKK